MKKQKFKQLGMKRKKSHCKEIQEIINMYSENLYSNKMESIEEMDKLLGTTELPKLNQEDVTF